MTVFVLGGIITLIKSKYEIRPNLRVLRFDFTFKKQIIIYLTKDLYNYSQRWNFVMYYLTINIY